MKIGFVISMYDEINMVQETIKKLHEHDCVIIVIQSDPGDKKKIVNSETCDFYEMMSDVSDGNYREKIEQEHKERKPEREKDRMKERTTDRRKHYKDRNERKTRTTNRTKERT